jgi:hypothetical protein
MGQQSEGSAIARLPIISGVMSEPNEDGSHLFQVTCADGRSEQVLLPLRLASAVLSALQHAAVSRAWAESEKMGASMGLPLVTLKVSAAKRASLGDQVDLAIRTEELGWAALKADDATLLQMSQTIEKLLSAPRAPSRSN